MVLLAQSLYGKVM